MNTQVKITVKLLRHSNGTAYLRSVETIEGDRKSEFEVECDRWTQVRFALWSIGLISILSKVKFQDTKLIQVAESSPENTFFELAAYPRGEKRKARSEVFGIDAAGRNRFFSLFVLPRYAELRNPTGGRYEVAVQEGTLRSESVSIFVDGIPASPQDIQDICARLAKMWNSAMGKRLGMVTDAQLNEIRKTTKATHAPQPERPLERVAACAQPARPALALVEDLGPEEEGDELEVIQVGVPFGGGAEEKFVAAFTRALRDVLSTLKGPEKSQYDANLGVLSQFGRREPLIH